MFLAFILIFYAAYSFFFRSSNPPHPSGTRKTYRAVLSEPKLVIPSVTTTTASGRAGEGSGSDVVDIQHAEPNEQSNLPYPVPTPSSSVPAKRTLAIDGDEPNNARASEGGTTDKESTRKKKRKKNKNVFNVG